MLLAVNDQNCTVVYVLYIDLSSRFRFTLACTSLLFGKKWRFRRQLHNARNTRPHTDVTTKNRRARAAGRCRERRVPRRPPVPSVDVRHSCGTVRAARAFPQPPPRVVSESCATTSRVRRYKIRDYNKYTYPSLSLTFSLCFTIARYQQKKKKKN